jgi:hypothetical protein
MIPCHVLVIFFLVFFHDFDLGLSMPLCLSWLGNLVILVVFMPMTHIAISLEDFESKFGKVFGFEASQDVLDCCRICT